MKDSSEALGLIQLAWPDIAAECRSVLGSELHYQAMVYYGLRTFGRVPIGQLAMNVKMWIGQPKTDLFQRLDLRKHEKFRGGFEPIPDICLFKRDISSDWRRRNSAKTLANLLVAIEVKASERKGARLRAGELIADIRKLAAHNEEAQHRGYSFAPVMMVIDTAPLQAEQMTNHSLLQSERTARDHGVAFMYVSRARATSTLKES